MKNLFKKSLLVLIGVLITSLTTQMWAWTPVYLNGNFTGNNWNNATYQINYELDGSNSGHYFYPFYSTSGDKYWRLYQQKNYNNYQLSPSSDNYVQNVGTAGYKVGKNGEKNFKSTTIKNGVTAVHINQNSGGDESPYVWLERPTIYIWHNWNNNTSNWNNNGGSGQKAMTDKEDGTYTYDGLFAGTSSTQNKTNVGIEGSAAIKKYFSSTDATVVGSPTTGDKCRFTWNSSGYKGYDGETSHRGSLTITKLCKVTYNGNSKTSGTVPSTQADIMYNTSVTLASKGDLARTNYVFTGWNTSADGTGQHYDAGESVTITATTLALYAEWEPQWSIKGGATASGDAMGDWDKFNSLPYVSGTTYRGTISLAAKTTYSFKVVDRVNNTWYGKSSTSFTRTGTTSASGLVTTDGDTYNMSITTDAAGTYTFEWNTSGTKTISVTFPTAYTITFGIGDLNGSNSSITATATPSFSSGDYVLRATAVTFNKGTTKAGYQFDGWYPNSDGSGVAWSTTDANWTSAANTRSANIKVYACYSYQTYSITYKDEGNVDFSGTHGDGYPTTHTYNTGTDLVDPTKTGYDFDGWYTTSTCDNDPITSIGATAYTDNITLYAKWTAKEYTVTLDAGDGEGGTDKVTATFGADMPSATMPTRDHYTFSGYYGSAGGSGTKYYNADGSSANVWDVASATTIYADWTEVTHTVSFANDGNGTTSPSSDYSAGEVTGVAISATPNAGYKFVTWTSDNGGTFASAATVASNTFYPEDDATLTASFTEDTYTDGVLDKVNGTTDGTYSVTFNDTKIVIGDEPVKAGFEVVAYYGSYDNEKDEYEVRVAEPDGTLNSNKTGFTDANGKWTCASAPKLYTRWTPKLYTITLDRQGGTTGSESFTVHAGNSDYSSITFPSRTGYTFTGYYTSGGTQIFDENEDIKVSVSGYTDGYGRWTCTDDDLTLYAHWTANPYTITLNNQSATTAGSISISVTFDATTNLTSEPAITVPEKTGYTFGGYYTAVAGGGVQVIAASGNVNAQAGGDDTYTSSTKQWKYADDIDLYAKWTQIIEFDQNSATVEGTDELAATYNGALSTGGITNPKKIGYAFAGWATAASDGSVVIEPDGTVATSVTNYTDGSGNWIHAGTSTLYATWTSDVNNFKADAATTAWGTATNWSKGEVPSEYTEVHIKGDVTVSSHVYVGKVVIEEGTLTIASTGALEVAGAVVNTDASKLVINTTSSSQGALIYDISTTSPYATVNMTTSKTNGDNFQYIASPIGGASVMSTFAGKGVYTYAWIEGKGWDRRGYYEDFSGSEVIVLNGQSNCSFSGQLYPSTGGSLTCMDSKTEGFVASAQGVNMIPNTLTAPIKIAEITISGSSDGAVHVWEDGDWADYAPASLKASGGEDVIPALQGYAVLASSSGSVSFDYDDAVRGASSHNDALRAPKRTATDTPDYMKISVTTNDRKIDLQLSEHEQFTSGIDKGWEAIYMDGDGRFGELYAQSTEKMSIFATPDLEGTVLGFVPGETMNYTISFEGDGKGYYLNDMVTEQSTLIDEDNTYVFSSSENNAARFVISKTPINKVPTGYDAINDGVKARKQMINGILYIIRDGRIYSAQGALVK